MKMIQLVRFWLEMSPDVHKNIQHRDSDCSLRCCICKCHTAQYSYSSWARFQPSVSQKYLESLRRPRDISVVFAGTKTGSIFHRMSDQKRPFLNTTTVSSTLWCESANNHILWNLIQQAWYTCQPVMYLWFAGTLTAHIVCWFLRRLCFLQNHDVFRTPTKCLNVTTALWREK